MSLSDIEKQDLRHAVLYAFANRPDAELTPAQAKLSVTRLLPFAMHESDVLAAIRFHTDLGHLREILDEWGSETTHTITAQGTLAYERDRNKIA